MFVSYNTERGNRLSGDITMESGVQYINESLEETCHTRINRSKLSLMYD